MRTIPLLLLACVAAQPAAAQRSRRDRDRDVQTDSASWQWHGPLGQGKTLTIRNINGDIEARAGRGAEAVVKVQKWARRHADPADVQIHVVQERDGVTICAVYPWQDAGPNECPRNSDHRRRHGDDEDDSNVTVRFTVEVPAGVDFVGHTVNGDASADSMPANGEVHTVNGSVALSARGHGSATPVNGTVNVTLGRNDWGREGGEFKTVNGDVVVTLPADLNADISASTLNGDLITDFPMTIQGRFGRQRMRGKIGTGGTDLEFATVNGDIKIRQR